MYCKIAGVTYEIEYQYSYIEKMFRDYVIEYDETNNREDIIKICCTDNDIHGNAELFPQGASVSYMEYLCIMDKIASMLPSQGMILMHGAAIEYEGKGYIFTAPSGTGKSTHISLWKKYLGDKVIVINGDKPELTFDDCKVYIHGAPWCGKEGWQTNKSTTLAGICLLRRGEQNKINKINPGQYIEFFIEQFYFGKGDNVILNVIDIFHKIAKRVPFYLLECNISEEAAKCSFEALTGKEWRKNES